MIEVFHQQVGDNLAEFGGLETSAILLHVLAFLDGGQDRSVGGRTADAVRFELLHERGFVEAWRRLGEMLLGLDRP